jgi:predicted GNAT family N-acyltransferase
MDGLVLKIAESKEDLNKVFQIRDIVFCDEQKVPKDLEKDSCDAIAEHFLMLLKNKPIGCARIRFNGNEAKLERIAILKEYRGKGLGRPLMKCLIDYCKMKNAKQIYMHAQYHAKGFYEKTGFIAKGKPFIEADIKHVEMVYEAKK